MIGIFDGLKIGIGALVGAAIVTPIIHHLGVREGRQQAAVAALETTVADFVTKGKINGQVSSADAASLCTDLGLPDGDVAECVRRLREASAKP